jgi:hypothetical protein
LIATGFELPEASQARKPLRISWRQFGSRGPGGDFLALNLHVGGGIKTQFDSVSLLLDDFDHDSTAVDNDGLADFSSEC